MQEVTKLKIVKTAMAGTLESSDAMVTVEPSDRGIVVEIKSSVINQFGRQIKSTALETLQNLGVSDAILTIVDQGALDCTLRARIECAVHRSNDIVDRISWGGAVK